MFNLFRKKEKQLSPTEAKNALRLTMLGHMEPTDWPKGHVDGMPWSLFIEARENAGRNTERSIEALQMVLATPALETRHYLQAWYFLRKLKVNPSPEESRRVYGVVVDVCLQNGTEYVAAYADHRARYMNYTGSGIVWEAPDTSLDGQIDTLLGACQNVANHIQPLDNILPNPPKQVNAVQICILTPGGIRHGIGTFEGWAKEPTGAPIVNAASMLMKCLVDKRIA